MQDIKKWFGRWDAIHFLHDAQVDSFVIEAFLQHQFIRTQEKCGRSCFVHYTTYIRPNCKITFFAERENQTHQYILEPISLSTI